jgi:imidazolonepropionase-like amidohydrolase
MRLPAALLTLTALCACATHPPAPAPAAKPTLALTHVTVVPMDREGSLADQTVLVQGERIVAVGPAASTAVPADATVVDGTGRFLMPGLVDAHLHLPKGDGQLTDAAGQTLALLLSQGVTTARALGAAPGSLALRERVEKGEVLGPRLFVAAPSLHGIPNPKAKPVQGPEDVRARVKDAKAQGFDLLKTHGLLPRETYDALVDEARAQGLRLSGHVTPEVGLRHALEAGQQVEHLDGYLAELLPEGDPAASEVGQMVFEEVLERMDPSRIPELVEATKRAGVYNSPTLALFELIASDEGPAALRARPEMRYASSAAIDAWTGELQGELAAVPAARKQRFRALRAQLTQALYARGAGMLVGSDSPQIFMVAGFALHRELQAQQAAGVSPFQVLRAATRGLAEFQGEAEHWGSVAVGQRADLLLLDANPLQDVRNAQAVRGVMLRGRWLTRERLQAPLDEIERQVQAAP